MPTEQTGGATKIGKTWRASWYDENGSRRTSSGFATKTAARKHAREKADEVKRIRSGERAPDSERPATVNQLVDVFLLKHGPNVDPATKRKLTDQLKHARQTFGIREPDRLRRVELEDWRQELSPGVRHDVFRAFRQALAWGVARGLVDRDPSKGIENPKRRREERVPIYPFETWAEIEAVAAELDVRYAAIPIFAAATGMRPEEWIGLHRADVDRPARVVHVRRRYSGGQVKPGTKTGGERVVPLTRRALVALDAMPPRIDSMVLFPAPRGGHIDLEKFRYREWTPALRAAGIPHRSVYSLRHTYASHAIAAGVPIATLGQVMGTSVAMLEETYVRYLKQTAESVRELLDAADQKAVNE